LGRGHRGGLRGALQIGEVVRGRPLILRPIWSRPRPARCQSLHSAGTPRWGQNPWRPHRRAACVT
jgi:hypothetical protein